MNLSAESITALKSFGYTQREAEFLYIVAAHSGFFLQRHFTQFVDVAGRGPATYFIKKAIEKQHVREHLPERGTQKIYHLFSRTVYAAIGKENSRHRRPGRYGMLEKAGVRMLSLDFVLANPDGEYLEEENDKVDYFVRRQSIQVEILPVRVFPGAQGTETRRYFFENFPMFLSQTNGLPVVNFTYIEDDIRSIQTFGSFVERYRPLFEGLANRFKLIFVSNSAQSFQLARNAFARSLSPAEREREHQQLARFFWLKKMAEEKRFKELAHKEVIEWQRGVRRYSDPSYETQFQTWKETGKLPESNKQSALSDPGQRFETFLAVPAVVRLTSSAATETAQPSAQLPAQERPA
jgi:hypothetical protein